MSAWEKSKWIFSIVICELEKCLSYFAVNFCLDHKMENICTVSAVRDALKLQWIKTKFPIISTRQLTTEICGMFTLPPTFAFILNIIIFSFVASRHVLLFMAALFGQVSETREQQKKNRLHFSFFGGLSVKSPRRHFFSIFGDFPYC